MNAPFKLLGALRIPLSLTFFAVAAVRSQASAPDSIAGSILYLSGSVPISHAGLSYGFELNSGGALNGLFRISTSTSYYPIYLLDPSDGTWTYQKIDDSTAQIVLTGGSAGGIAGTATMKFTSDSTGDFLGAFNGNAILFFRLAPQGSSAPLCNCSNRSFVPAGGAAFAGFVITPGGSGFVLVRAVGPGLAQFGITNFLIHPTISVTNATNTPGPVTNDGWDAVQPSGGTGLSIIRTGALVGAFPLSAGSKDSAVVMEVPPGAYIAQASSPSATDSGQVLIEVYVLP